jgi:hypothetical protein
MSEHPAADFDSDDFPVAEVAEVVWQGGGMSHVDLMAGPPPTHLPEDPATPELESGGAPADVVRRHPASPTAWAALADLAREQGADDVTVYAYARVGYHRSLDLLRRNGWKGHGPVPWEHEPNRGFLRCLAALADASERIGDSEEADRCRQFLRDADPECPLL